ncbi:plant virulence effector HPE1-like domain-containing protein [Pararhizobium sp. O133]|uniref:plant virulence effector HPE1-like domain-containing protein n=1 Tax=Pararhizobium sp. O133 TaxID=3449278 RepID=UPI003F683B5D
MRALLFTLASLASAGVASASSIENLATGPTDDRSVAHFSCPDCTAPVVARKNLYVVPEIAHGSERTELKTINGELKVVRTEAWLGGSPVVFISKASDDDIKAAGAKTAPRKQPLQTAITAEKPAQSEAAATTTPVIDTAAKTGSLDTASMASMASLTPQDSHSQEVDLEKFELRLK